MINLIDLQTASLSEPVKLAATLGEEKVPAPFNVQTIHLSGVFYMRRFWKKKHQHEICNVGV